MTKDKTIIFETDRLVLRQLVLDDLDDLWDFHRNPENVKYYQDAPGTLDEVREELECDLEWDLKNAELGRWAIIHKETGKLIGLCSLLPLIVDGIEEVEMAYILGEDYRGQGLGSELSQAVLRYGFEKLKLSRIVSLIEPGNKVSQHVVEKAGMRFEKEWQEESGLFLVYSISQTGQH